MANFFKIKETPDTELIINIDKIKMMQKTPTLCKIWVGDEWFCPKEEVYEQIKKYIFDPFDRNRTT